MSEPVVEARALWKTYFGRVNVPVLRDVALRVDEGEFVTIVGQPGAGKSTLLCILGCLERPTSGVLRIDGQDVTAMSEDALTDFRTERIGFIFQYPFLLDEFTCLENALVPILVRRGRVERSERARVIRLMQRVGLGSQMGRTPDTLSSAENLRCAIARAFANQPRLVLADDPTGSLDSKSSEQVYALLRELNAETGTPIVQVTQNDRIAKAADRILLMESGAVREMSTGARRSPGNRPVVFAPA